MKHNVLFYRGYGKVGNLVGYQIYGKQAFRAWNPVVKNPNTAAQRLQRAKLAMLTRLIQQFHGPIVLGFRDEAKASGMSAVNYFAHRNYRALRGGTPEALTIDPSVIEIAKGSLPFVEFNSAIGIATPGKLTVTIADALRGVEGADDDDVVRVYLHVPDANAGVWGGVTKRGEATALEINFPAAWSGLEGHVYGFVTGGGENSEEKSSNSTYINHTELP